MNADDEVEDPYDEGDDDPANDIESFEDQVNKIVASPNQASLFMDEEEHEHSQNRYKNQQINNNSS